MANVIEDIVARLRGFFGGQQELLNPVVDPEDSYIENLRAKFKKSGSDFGQKQEMQARQIYRTEMARQSQERLKQQTPRPTVAPAMQAAMPMPTASPAVLSATTSIDPKTLPTYNNPAMLERVKPYLQFIQKSAQQYGMPPELLAAALWRESAGFDPKYIGTKDANGNYIKHTDGTGRGIAGIDAVQRKDVPDSVAYDPPQAVDWMAKTLKTYADQENGNYYNALRRYNGGPNYNDNRPGYKGVPVSQLTKKHADYITANSQNLKQLFSSPVASPAPTLIPTR